MTKRNLATQNGKHSKAANPEHSSSRNIVLSDADTELIIHLY